MNMSPQDEAKLTWFFGRGQTAFERSTIGPMLARAELFGHAGELRYSERAAGFELQAERLRRTPAPWASVTDGAIVYSGRELTARPTAEVRQASGHTPNLADMERYAWVSRVLCAVERRSVLAYAVLEAYHGDLGLRWAREPKPGKAASIYHLTQAGERLLAASAAEASKSGQPVIGSPERRMANEIARAGKSERVRVGVARCDRQATLLLREAHELWSAVQQQLERGRAA